MAETSDSYHYLIQDGKAMLEQVTHQPDSQADLFVEQVSTIYKKSRLSPN